MDSNKRTMTGRIAKAIRRHGTFRIKEKKCLHYLCLVMCFMLVFYEIHKLLHRRYLLLRSEEFLLPQMSGLHTRDPPSDSQFRPIQISMVTEFRPIETVSHVNAREVFQWPLKRHHRLFKETKLFPTPEETPFNVTPPSYYQNLSYLQLTNTFYHDSSIQYTSAKERSAIEDTIRMGFNLEPLRSGWRENGIVYRPKKRPRQASGDQKQDDYDTDFEAYVPFDEKKFFQGKRAPGLRPMTMKVILWQSPSTYTNSIPNLQVLKSCPNFPCALTTQRTVYQNNSSAVIFPAESITGHPPTRSTPDQIFIFHNTQPYTWPERREKDFSEPAWKSTFNWTMTYRFDSDIVLPFGVVRRRPQPLKAKNYHKVYAEKKLLMAYLSDNCVTSSQREVYVAYLQRFLRVDVIGKCGEIKCQNSPAESCADWIAKEYKFVLAFEDALCPDYVTEKLFYFFQKDIVVIARGSNDYFLHLPSETFINTDDFTPRMLAKNVRYLDKHRHAYLNVLREKDKYMVMFDEHPKWTPSGEIERTEYLFSGVPMCQICYRLWNLDIHAKTIRDIHHWFDRKVCRYSTDLMRL